MSIDFSSLAFTPTPTLHTTHQRREMCCLFADVVGSTELAFRLPLEEYAALMTQLTDWLQLEVQTYGAAVSQAQGDAVIALWHVADIAQAQYAALCLHEGISQLEPARRHQLQLRLRVGLACGALLLSDQQVLSSSYGLPLNLARRLCSAAQPSQTLICAHTAQQLPAQQRRLLAHLQLGGFAEPVQAYALEGLLLTRPVRLRHNIQLRGLSLSSWPQSDRALADG